MASDSSGWGDGWALKLRVWSERDGRSILGPGRLELLEHVDRFQSISAAARQMGMSYRRAWLLIQDVNASAGEPIVTAQTGGTGGGGAILTTFGRRAISHFRTLTNNLTRTAGELIRVKAMHGVHLLAAVSLEEVVGRMLADFALVSPDVRVRGVFGASDELASLIASGTPADLFLTADPKILDRMATKPVRRTLIAENSLALIAAAASKLAAGRVTNLLIRSANRLALAQRGCPLGEYTAKYLSAAKIDPIPSERIVRADNSRSVIATVRSGQADLGIVYASDAAQADGCRILSRVDRLPGPIRYEAASFAGDVDDNHPALRLLRFLTSKAAAARFRECGFRPVTANRKK